MNKEKQILVDEATGEKFEFTYWNGVYKRGVGRLNPIKPHNIIDLSVLVNGMDCEFSDESNKER